MRRGKASGGKRIGNTRNGRGRCGPIAGNARFHRRLRIEPLEDRRLLAIIVDTLVDENDGVGVGGISLRDAIAAAPAGETIQFAPALTTAGPATILLTRGELPISNNLTISGPGAALLTVDASGNDPTPNQNNGDGSRVFDINNGTNFTLIDVSIRGLTITGGDITREGGGGIRSSENLTVVACWITGNSAVLTSFGAPRGGGIYCPLGNLSVGDSTISENWAGIGGGIAVQSEDTSGLIPPTTIAILTNSTITGNKAGNAGGIFGLACDLTITNCTISENSGYGPLSPGGGGIAAVGRGSLTILGSTIANNASNTEGGGIRIGTLAMVANSTISGNKTESVGGGIAIDNGRLTMTGSTVSGNSSRFYGGGISSSYRSYLSISGSTISDNTAGDLGGGIQNGGSTLNVTNSTITNNSARSGGGIAKGFYFIPTGVVTIGNSTISGNTAREKGGGIYSNYNPYLLGSGTGASYGNSAGATRPERGRLIVTGTTIDGNSAALGGGVWTGDGNVNVTSSTISGNAASGVGGGLYWNPLTHLDTAPQAAISHSTIAFNSAKGPGGGIFVTGGPMTLDHTIVARNSPLSALQSSSVTGPDLTGTVGTVFDPRYSLIGNSRDTGLAPAPVGSPDSKGNLIGGVNSFTAIDPLLAPLSNKGGPTMTHELLVGSPAIDAGDAAAMRGAGDVPAFDQRSAPFTRVADGDGMDGARIDIGAFESQTVGPALPGDYHADGCVDTADYVVWRNTLGRNVPPFSGADGNGDGIIDQDDHAVWQANFGRLFPEVGSEASALVVMEDPHPLATNASRRCPSRPLPVGEAKADPLALGAASGMIVLPIVVTSTKPVQTFPVMAVDYEPTVPSTADQARAFAASRLVRRMNAPLDVNRDSAILAWYSLHATDDALKTTRHWRSDSAGEIPVRAISNDCELQAAIDSALSDWID